ncbi:MAG: PAS domain-containing sensor histidine kinase [Planctomycetes bacterium]|nr:PAS domain-containing sensor histidine kinase [Planctomycetota bacterium]
MASSKRTRSTEAALRERVKELTCLYGIAQISGQPGISLEEMVRGIVELLPAAWQYPEIASARITLHGDSYSTQGFRDGAWTQRAEVVVNNTRCGAVEVVYAEDRPELDEGPFLREERNLLDAVARQVALIVERKQGEKDKSKLQEQLRHADRLATIGTLAAGVAHEMNEPVGSILGFAQLASTCPGLPESARRDIGKIEAAALHTREIIKKLLVFARQVPPHKARVNLNRIVEEGIYFFEARCAKEGVEVVRSLAPDLPEITGDVSQLNQVLVNLVVNALQAMPDGGKLIVETRHCGDEVLLIVEDTGTGMSEEVREQIFVPFFTTKDVGQGTGLGLPVAHGIVTSHGGSLKVHSQAGCGTRFEVRLPVAEPPGTEENCGDVVPG